MNADRGRILARAQAANLLDSRIAANAKGQGIDLAEWIREGLAISRGARILELCCGTGAQTLGLLEAVGDDGVVVAVDISADALKKLSTKVPPRLKSRLMPVEASLDDLRYALEMRGLTPPHFDVAFCAYGLYYASEPIDTLQEAGRWLVPGGRMIIVGPFGPNNAHLFSLLDRAGVDISAFAKYTSASFMHEAVLPWLSERFSEITIRTVVNPVTWENPDSVLDYWRNTTFFDSEQVEEVERLLRDEFCRESAFVNQKWIMMVESAGGRL